MTTVATAPLAAEAAASVKSRRSRLRLDTPMRVRRELVRLYREGRDGERDTLDASRLAGVLCLVAALAGGSGPMPDRGDG